MSLSFDFILQPTYYKQGFFNVSVRYQNYFGNDDEAINILYDNYKISGHINRRCNNTYAPRIFGKSALREWFQENFEQKDVITVTVVSKNTIKLSKTSSDNPHL